MQKQFWDKYKKFFNSKKLFPNTFKCWFEAFIVAFDWYLFQLVTFLKPDDKVNTGTQNLVSVIESDAAPADWQWQFADQVRIK